MKSIIFVGLFLVTTFSFSQEADWVKTNGEITEITTHGSKWQRSSAVIKFHLEDGTEQLGSAEILRIPFIGGLNYVGDTITIYYNKNNPVLIETSIGRFITNYGMYILIILGIIVSISRILKAKKSGV